MHTARDKANCCAETAAPSPLSILERMDRLFQKLFFLIPIGIIGNILFSLATAKREVLASVLHFSPGYLALAMSLSVVPWFTGSLRLFIWSRFLGKRISYPAVFKIVIGAELGAAVSPPLIGGNAVKVGMLMQQKIPGGAAVSLTALESLEDSLFFVIMVPLALTISSSWDLPLVRSALSAAHRPGTWAVLFTLGIVIAFLFHAAKKETPDKTPVSSGSSPASSLKEKVRAVFRDFITVYRLISKRGKSRLMVTMSLTAFQWICRYSIISLLLVSLGIPAEPVLFMALQVIVFFLMTFVPTPGAVGGAEVMFSLMYRAFLPADTVGLVTAGWRFLTFYFLLLLAAVLSLLFGVQPRAATPQVAEHKDSRDMDIATCFAKGEEHEYRTE